MDLSASPHHSFAILGQFLRSGQIYFRRWRWVDFLSWFTFTHTQSFCIRISLINWIWHDAHYFMRFINFLINRCQDVTTSIRLTSVYMSMKLHKISLLCAKCWIELHLIISTPSISVEKNSNCISKCFQRIPIGWKNVRRSGRTRSLLTTFTDHSRGLIWSNH